MDWNILVMFQGGFEDAGNVLERLEYSFNVLWWIGRVASETKGEDTTRNNLRMNLSLVL